MDDARLEAGRLLLGSRLRAERQAAGLSLREVAQAAALSVSFLSDIERGRNLPTLPTLVAMADLYSTTADALLAGVYPFGTSRRPRRTPRPPADGRRSPRS